MARVHGAEASRSSARETTPPFAQASWSAAVYVIAPFRFSRAERHAFVPPAQRNHAASSFAVTQALRVLRAARRRPRRVC